MWLLGYYCQYWQPELSVQSASGDEWGVLPQFTLWLEICAVGQALVVHGRFIPLEGKP